MKLTGPVLVATALDTAGEEAVRQAAGFAARAGQPLVVCHVLPEIYGIRPLFPQLRESDRAIAEATRRAIFDALEAQVAGLRADGTLRVDVRVEAGSPHAVVLEAAEEAGAGMLVVGAGSRTGGASSGGVGERIVRHATVPVLVAHPQRGNAVIAATDFSDPAAPAVEAGRDEARRRGEDLIVLHAVEIPIVTMEMPEAAPTLAFAQILEAETEQAQALLKALAARYGLSDTRVRTGPPGSAILDEAERAHADLIVVGKHGRGGLKRLSLGSVAEAVVRRAVCSVLVVPLQH